MLQLEEVSKTYRHGRIEVQAVRPTSLSLEEPGFTLIEGPSGCGKTTLLNLIGLLDRPTGGRIRLENRDVATLSDRELTRLRGERIGFVFQSFNLMPVLTALENVEYGLLQTPLPARDRRHRVNEVIEAVGLGAHRHHRPNALSGGQRQRVAIARALVKRPALVLADEPTANLDSGHGAAILQLMRDMQQRFCTNFIFSTHDPLLVNQAQQLPRMRDGVVTLDPPASTVPKGVPC